jgi:uncharacterized protein YqjF (DUF2071 family)
MSKSPRKPGVFLTAKWRHLAVFNYAIEPQVLEPYLPAGLELDFWRGTTYISLLAFLFQDTRLWGVPIPFHRAFPEVNLRFYVKRPMPTAERRGVVFLREIAPRRAVAYVASKFYGEKYLALPMRACIEPDEQCKEFSRRARFEWRMSGNAFEIDAASDAPPQYPEPGSLDEFIIEHYWGYSVGKRRDDACLEYEVEHPRWRVRTADSAIFTGNAAALYGEEFAKVLGHPPASAFIADGSAVEVRRGTPLVGEKLCVPGNTRELATVISRHALASGCRTRTAG